MIHMCLMNHYFWLHNPRCTSSLSQLSCVFSEAFVCIISANATCTRPTPRRLSGVLVSRSLIHWTNWRSFCKCRSSKTKTSFSNQRKLKSVKHRIFSKVTGLNLSKESLTSTSFLHEISLRYDCSSLNANHHLIVFQIAFIGQSNVGKSSLVKSLFRSLNPKTNHRLTVSKKAVRF